jgi:hypothetical protein
MTDWNRASSISGSFEALSGKEWSEISIRGEFSESPYFSVPH